MFTQREQMPLAAGDVVRFTKNFVAKGGKRRTMISPRFKRLLVTISLLSDGRAIPTTALLHVDQGISVTSHASQGKTVDNVIVSAQAVTGRVPT
jgi:hypothetical protein